MNWQKWIGAALCLLLIAACFMHWAYYPDIDKHFTGFDTKVLFRGKEVNYYGRPGILICFFALACAAFHLIPQLWAKRANLLFSAICVAYAVKSFILFSTAYSGIEPQKEAGLWLMLIAAIGNLVAAATAKK